MLLLFVYRLDKSQNIFKATEKAVGQQPTGRIADKNIGKN